MKKVVLFAVLFFFVALPVMGQESVLVDYEKSDWYVKNFDGSYKLNSDSTIEVEESVEAFFNIEKHGIYRYIPTKYENDLGFVYNLKLNFDKVVDENEKKYNIAEFKSSKPFYLKIGSADTTLIGNNIYKIRYNVDRGIRFFDDHDEFYWNVTGHDWDALILDSSAKVYLPEGLKGSEVEVKCYAGRAGTESADCDFIIGNESVSFFTTDVIGNEAFEDFTVVVSMPKGYVIQPTTKDRILMWLGDNWMLFLPFVAFAIMFLLWRKYGDDPDQKAIVPMYEDRKDMSPFVADLILKDRTVLNHRALSAEIVNLAVMGYLKIEEILSDTESKKIVIKDYKLIQVKESDEELHSYQKVILNGIFKDGKEVNVKDLNKKFYVHLNNIRRFLADYTKMWYVQKPYMKWVYWSVAIVVAGLSVVGGTVLFRLDLTVGGIISAAIIMAFSFIMPKKNKAGMEAEWYALGLKRYISVAEKYRASFYEDKGIFEKVLPYAMVYGMVDKWADAFKDIYDVQPDWYVGNRAFTPLYLASAMNNFSTLTDKNMTVAPGSSSSSGMGGGFSGGGFGGGGGGSW